MDPGSDTGRVSHAGETTGDCGEKTDAPILDLTHMRGDPDAPREGDLDDAGCFTEAYFNRVLPPIPDWMRQPPKRKVPTLFDDLDDE